MINSSIAKRRSQLNCYIVNRTNSQRIFNANDNLIYSHLLLIPVLFPHFPPINALPRLETHQTEALFSAHTAQQTDPVNK